MKIIETTFDERVRQVRTLVFIQEQKISHEEEFDDEDDTARHWLALAEGEPVGTVRLAGTRLGRLAVLKEQRSRGIGQGLVKEVIRAAREQGLETLEAWVQTRAEPWYRKRGFQIYGEVFDDANIPHRKARLRL